MPRASRPRAARRHLPRAAPRAAGLLALSLLALGGCAEVQQLQTMVADRAPGSPPSERRLTIGPPGPRFADGVPAFAGVPPAPIEQPAAPAPAPEATPPATLAMAVPAPAAVAPSRPPLTDTRALIGLERSEVQARLGEPALRRRDNPAEIWQYRSSICVLDLFLYRDGNATRVTTVELRARDGRDVPAALCLSSL